jgi:hypothetical protein
MTGSVSSGPYEFGPASAAASAVVVGMSVFALLRLRGPQGDASERDELSLTDLVRSIFQSVPELDVPTVAPVLGTAVIVALALYSLPAALAG